MYRWFILLVAAIDTIRCPVDAASFNKFKTLNHKASIVNFSDMKVSINDTVTFNISATDAEGIKEYRWDIDGDGTFDKITSTGTMSFKVPSTTGANKVILAVIDNMGKSTLDTVTVTVTNTAPSITLTGPDTVGLHAQINLRAAIQDDGKIMKYEWSIARAGSAPVFLARSQADTTFFSPDSELPATLTATLRVTDDDGNISTDSIKTFVTMRWIKVADDVSLPGYYDNNAAAFFKDSIWYLTGDTIGATSDGIHWVFSKLPTAFVNRNNTTLTPFNNKLWSIGGTPPNGSRDIWSSPDGRTWTCDTMAADFTPVWGNAVTVFNGKLWLVGGSRLGNTSNEIWSSLDGKTWRFETNAAFPGRYNAPLLVFNNQFWVLGGSSSSTVLTDVWASTNGITWEQKTTSSFPDKTSLLYSGAIVYGNRMWIIGGSGTSAIWSSQDGIRWVKSFSSGPVPREDASLVVDSKNRLWVFGGYVPQAGEKKGVWYTADLPMILMKKSR